jgi:hypothetical protein
MVPFIAALNLSKYNMYSEFSEGLKKAKIVETQQMQGNYIAYNALVKANMSDSEMWFIFGQYIKKIDLKNKQTTNS